MSQETAFENPSDVLAHFGVKGMKWGKRKGEDSSPKISRKENRQLNREAADKFNQEKLTTIYDEAKAKGEAVLVKTRTPGDYATTVMTGKQFTEALEDGGYLDVNTTEIFARQPKPDAQYELNENEIGSYKKQDFRK